MEKSTLPSSSPMGGMMTSLTSESTILPNAAPMMMPTAMSTTLPRMANSLNSFSMKPPSSQPPRAASSTAAVRCAAL
ncbi:MAG: hypothetical protein ACT4P8_02910 [Betaproteobacteria bacterium]